MIMEIPDFICKKVEQEDKNTSRSKSNKSSRDLVDMHKPISKLREYF